MKVAQMKYRKYPPGVGVLRIFACDANIKQFYANYFSGMQTLKSNSNQVKKHSCYGTEIIRK